MKILVLGTGPVGREICAELISQGHKVISVDANIASTIPGHLNHHHLDIDTFIQTKLHLIRDRDLIINALPGTISYKILKTLIPLGVNIVDISFMEEDTSELDELAKLYKTRVVYDCGIAPGLCNIILGHHLKQEPVDKYACWVGGMPDQPAHPYYHKTLFSIKDLISEYTRPARYKENNKIKISGPLDIKYVYSENQFLESFYSDGLRSLLNLPISSMYELTLRHVGHIDTMRVLQTGGFLKPENIDHTIQVLAKEWQMGDGEKDIMRMKLLIETPSKNITYLLFDDYKEGVTAMARTTAYSCVAVVNALSAWGLRIPHGVMSPEEFIMNTEGDEAFDWIIRYIQKKGIEIIIKDN